MPSARDMKYGRREPKVAPALRFSAIREAVTPTYPPVFDSIAGWGGWQILGNDHIGDCVSVTWATERRIVTRIYANEYYPSLQQVIQFYKTQNPLFDENSGLYGPGSDADQGMMIQDALEYLNKNGGPDGVKAIAFAKVDHTNMAEIKAAHAIFNCVWLGVVVTANTERAFDRGEPWDWTTSEDELGGHSITGTGYDENLFNMETWAEECNLTKAFMFHGVDEAWVVLWPEHAAKLDERQRDELDKAYHDLTGRSIDWTDVPPFAPGPQPEPVADPDQTLADAIRLFLSKHPKFYKWFQKHLEDWMKKKGM